MDSLRMDSLRASPTAYPFLERIPKNRQYEYFDKKNDSNIILIFVGYQKKITTHILPPNTQIWVFYPKIPIQPISSARSPTANVMKFQPPPRPPRFRHSRCHGACRRCPSLPRHPWSRSRSVGRFCRRSRAIHILASMHIHDTCYISLAKCPCVATENKYMLNEKKGKDERNIS